MGRVPGSPGPRSGVALASVERTQQQVVSPVGLETIVFVVVIVLIVLFVLGYFGRGRITR
jgi:cobalamin biosynthesis Mg chelatase CobN